MKFSLDRSCLPIPDATRWLATTSLSAARIGKELRTRSNRASDTPSGRSLRRSSSEILLSNSRDRRVASRFAAFFRLFFANGFNCDHSRWPALFAAADTAASTPVRTKAAVITRSPICRDCRFLGRSLCEGLARGRALYKVSNAARSYPLWRSLPGSSACSGAGTTPSSQSGATGSRSQASLAIGTGPSAFPASS